jgi:hypothetical protein
LRNLVVKAIIGLKDMFRRKAIPDLEHERRLVQLESRLSTLREEWVDFKDMIRKQADRVEKRAQRSNGKPPCEEYATEALTHQERILARRRLRRGRSASVPTEG